jgi:alkylation response protein AidB-like acyl-CoA dehydrogenase
MVGGSASRLVEQAFPLSVISEGTAGYNNVSLNFAAVKTAVTELLPEIAARAPDYERERRIPNDLAAKLKSSGVFRIGLPKRVGGVETSAVERLGILEDVAAADASAGWTVAIGVQSPAFLSNLSSTDFARLYLDTPNLVLAGCGAPTGQAQPCDGGYRINGRWAWASGCLHADWLFVNCLALKDGAPQSGSIPGRPLMISAIFPAESARMHHDESWFVSGLRGTGSCDISVADLFVPTAFTFDSVECAPDGPEASLLPPLAVGALQFAAVAVGVARGAVDDVIALARSGKQRAYSSARSAEQPVFQFRVGEAETRLRAARALLHVHAELVDREAADLPRGFPLLLHPLTKATAATSQFVVRLAAEAVDVCADIAGGSSIHDSSPLQRRRRDIHTLSQHVTLGDPMMTRHGAGLLGIEVMP